uniref:Uncharacterized protein n=1 Tax=Tetranychus urticae TaxID=32264 RepID=T1KEY7_TETUR
MVGPSTGYKADVRCNNEIETFQAKKFGESIPIYQ